MLYDWRCYRNMNTAEAMDSAQVARNLAEGHGFTTLFIRPLSLYLLEQHNEAKMRPGAAGAGQGLRGSGWPAPGPGQSALVSLRAGGMDEDAIRWDSRS